MRREKAGFGECVHRLTFHAWIVRITEQAPDSAHLPVGGPVVAAAVGISGPAPLLRQVPDHGVEDLLSGHEKKVRRTPSRGKAQSGTGLHGKRARNGPKR